MYEEDGAITKHTKSCSIPRSTAYKILKLWNECDGIIISIGCIRIPSEINRAVKSNNDSTGTY